MITCGGSRFAAMKKISSGTLNQKLNRETTNATAEENSRMITIAGIVTIIEFQKCSGMSPCVPRVPVVVEAEGARQRDVAVLGRVRVRAAAR